MTDEVRPPLPPFTYNTSVEKVRKAEDAWNTRHPGAVSLAYTANAAWRNRSSFVNGREEIVAFLTSKWEKELDYRLIKEIWAFSDNRISVRFAYEWHDAAMQWWRSYGNENWELDKTGLMDIRHASTNDIAIVETDRLFYWPLDDAPFEHAGLGDLGL